MNINFDLAPERRGTDSVKWDAIAESFGITPCDDLIPMWIADMDLPTAPELLEAVRTATSAGVLGYRTLPERFYHAVAGWMKTRHHLEIDEEIILPLPGVIPGISAAIDRFTSPGDGVIIQPPVYPPFFDTPRGMGRTVLENRLIEREDGGILTYDIDFAGLRALAARPEAKLMILCSPHNPLGRVWSREELRLICRICAENGVFLVSDEIHADVILGGKTFTPVLAAAADCGITSGVIQLGSPSKSFNVAGTHTAYMLVPVADERAKLRHFFESMHLPTSSYVSADIAETAYGAAAYYPDELIAYLEGNMAVMIEALRSIPGLRVTRPDATYLLWADLRGCGIPPERVHALICARAHVVANPGESFAPDRVGCLRINVAATRAVVEEAARRIVAALTAEF